MTTYERVRRCAAVNWGLEEATLTPETTFAGGKGRGRPPVPPQKLSHPDDSNDLPTDSLELVELMMVLEEEFELKLSDTDAVRFADMTLGELAEEMDRQRRINSVDGDSAEGESA